MSPSRQPTSGLSGEDAGEPDLISRWRSFHLFYHEDRDRLLLDLVRPLLVSLWQQGRIRRAFFIRYPLGGPHIRLRLEATEGFKDEVDGEVRESAERFFRRSPSTRPWPEAEVRRFHESILANEPTETDSTLYPDNHLITAPFTPEVDRYGGREYLLIALDFFCCSSSSTLTTLASRRESLEEDRLKLGMTLLTRQARGCARDADELLELLDYSSPMWGRKRPRSVVERADQVFERRPEVFSEVLRRELMGEGSDPGAAGSLSGSARGMSAALDGTEGRRRALLSQIHMTGNRLGLSPPEEVYLSQLLSRAAHRLLDRPGFGDELGEILAREAEQPLSDTDQSGLEEWVEGSFRSLAGTL